MSPVFPGVMKFRPKELCWIATLCVALARMGSARAADHAFESAALPFLKAHCLDCHSSARPKGELDLERFTSQAAVVADPGVWEKVLDQIALGEMPPKARPRPDARELEAFQHWIREALRQAALANAGDPGPVVLRRLNNAEYTYLIRDLTGVPTLNPAAEFPTDSAAGEGFMNVGGALVMSPALVTKYLDAAKAVAAHAVLLPDRIEFSPSPFRRDWINERLDRIRGFYDRFTVRGAGTGVNLQGIQFETNAGGVIPLARYFEALLEAREALAKGSVSLAQIASAKNLSLKYLTLLSRALEGGESSILMDALRARWKAARPGDGDALAQWTRRWQELLWRFETVGHIGKRDGPRAWQVPASPWDASGNPTQELAALASESGIDDALRGERTDLERAFDGFRDLFPAALCYTQIVPVDETVTLTLFYREDDQLSRLMLAPEEAHALDRLWADLRYVSQDALQLVDAYEQLWQYATQDADPSVFTPMRDSILQRAADFRKWLIDTEPVHVAAVLEFAHRACRRPLDADEREELRTLYQRLRAEEIPHEDSIRLLIARVLVSPSFLYRIETPPPGEHSAPVNDWELASRLSFFLWSSAPDEALRASAAAGALRDPAVLRDHARRMLQNPRTRRLAVEFACAWLGLYDFNELDEKSERHFPEFRELRESMREETVQFFTDLFQGDRSILEIIDADHTFLNAPLARLYGVEGVDFPGPDAWKRVDGVKQFGRGGVLAQAAPLSRQSGASRTSPILRGNWISEVILGEKLPRPPPDVPQLPQDEAAETLTVRELTERHVSDPRCSGCHRRIDPYGFALEEFDAIGRRRDRDLGGRELNLKAGLIDGAEIEGLAGLRAYLLGPRRDAFVAQFCRKLLGYALGRSALLSDAPLLQEMADALRNHDYRVSAAIETLVTSRQFREIRGRDFKALETTSIEP